MFAIAVIKIADLIGFCRLKGASFMRRVHGSWLSTSALVATLAISSPALAETQPVPPDPNATAQTNPAQPAQNADAPTIVVTGQRRALRSARNVKRNSDQIVDSI